MLRSLFDWFDAFTLFYCALTLALNYDGPFMGFAALTILVILFVEVTTKIKVIRMWRKARREQAELDAAFARARALTGGDVK